MFRWVFLTGYFMFLLVPLYWAVVTAFKPQEDLLAQPPVWFPHHPTTAHFGQALHRLNGLTGLENSVIVAFATTALATLVGTAAAYSMARFHTGGKNLSFWFLSQRLLPPVAVVIPVFLLYSQVQQGVDRDQADGQPDRVDPALHGLRAAVDRLDDVLVLPPDAAGARAGGARGRVHALAGALEDRGAPFCARPRDGGGVRVHLLVDPNSCSPLS